MPTIGKPKPQLFRSVEKPDSISTKELAEARPVYIDGLPEGGGGSSTTDGVTIEGIPDTIPDGTPLNEYFVQIASLTTGLIRDIKLNSDRIDALEAASAG